MRLEERGRERERNISHSNLSNPRIWRDHPSSRAEEQNKTQYDQMLKKKKGKTEREKEPSPAIRKDGFVCVNVCLVDDESSSTWNMLWWSPCNRHLVDAVNYPREDHPQSTLYEKE